MHPHNETPGLQLTVNYFWHFCFQYSEIIFFSKEGKTITVRQNYFQFIIIMSLSMSENYSIILFESILSAFLTL